MNSLLVLQKKTFNHSHDEAQLFALIYALKKADNNSYQCRTCDRTDITTGKCLLYGQTCTKCSRENHYILTCRRCPHQDFPSKEAQDSAMAEQRTIW